MRRNSWKSRQNVLAFADRLSPDVAAKLRFPAFSCRGGLETRVQVTVLVDTMLQELEVHFESDRAKLQAGAVYSFVPAHGGSKAGAVAEQLSRILSEGLGIAVLLADFEASEYSPWNSANGPRRLDGRTWGAFVSDIGGIKVLNAREVHPRELRRVFDYAHRNYGVVCADLTDAKDAQALEVLRSSESIFLVATSDSASLEMAREKAEWLSSIDMIERCGLLLEEVPGGLNAAAAEEITGLPVCSLVNNDEQIGRLAEWLAVQEPPADIAAVA